MELSYCERGHYAEKMSSGRCKDCIEENNDEFLSDLSFLERNERKRNWLEKRNSYVTDENFDKAMKKRNSNAKIRYAKAGKEDIGDFTPEEIKFLLDKQNNECRGCFTSFSDVAFEIDHKDAVGLYSKNELSNLQLLCVSCNRSKGDYSNDAFISEMRYKQVMQYLFELQEEESYAT